MSSLPIQEFLDWLSRGRSTPGTSDHRVAVNPRRTEYRRRSKSTGRANELFARCPSQTAVHQVGAKVAHLRSHLPPLRSASPVVPSGFAGSFRGKRRLGDQEARSVSHQSLSPNQTCPSAASPCTARGTTARAA